MSDVVCIMRDGRIVQSGPPKTLYDEPVNKYVADFVGRSNFHQGVVSVSDRGTTSVRLDNGLEMSGRWPVTAAPLNRGDRAVLMTRPELISLAGQRRGPESDFSTGARIKNRIFLGEHTEYLVEAQHLGDILVLTPKKEDSTTGGFAPGDEVVVGWPVGSALVLADN